MLTLGAKAKGANKQIFVLTLGAGRPKCPKTFFKVRERENMQNQTIFELCTDDNKSKYPSNPKDILKFAKNIMKLYTKWTSTVATTEFVWKIPDRKEISNQHSNLCEAEISLDEIIKSINSETNNKPPGNDGLTAEIIDTYRHPSKEIFVTKMFSSC